MNSLATKEIMEKGNSYLYNILKFKFYLVFEKLLNFSYNGWHDVGTLGGQSISDLIFCKQKVMCMKPFLKWAGNKYQIIEHIQEILPKDRRLIEPFVGSGAVFLNTDYSQYLLADANADLINLYQFLQTNGSAFIEDCRERFTSAYNNETDFYVFRDIFNTTKDKYLKALLFVYLNKHSFNGLCRYNLNGKFNVPFGKYKKPYFPEVEINNFIVLSKKAVFKHENFIETMRSATIGDVVYCDPPYAPISETANFTAYSAGGFSMENQLQLAVEAEHLAKKGISVVVSNHDTPFIRKAYQRARLHTLEVQRFISCNGNNRGKVKEILAVFD